MYVLLNSNRSSGHKDQPHFPSGHILLCLLQKKNRGYTLETSLNRWTDIEPEIVVLVSYDLKLPLAARTRSRNQIFMNFWG